LNPHSEVFLLSVFWLKQEQDFKDLEKQQGPRLSSGTGSS
jgi:hypothetical protein